jgi:Holliday junction resolvase RusA-like endonuclease
MVESSKAVKPWREAVKSAVLDAIPLIDDHFKKRGQCGVCGTPGLDARHRLIDTINERVRAGDDIAFVADDYGINETAVRTALMPLDGPLAVSMVFTLRKPASAPKRRRTWPDRTPDLSKLARATEDALTDAGVWADDARVVEYVRLAKVFPGEDRDALHIPGVVVRIWQMTP